MKFLERLKTSRQRVEFILKIRVDSRDNDNLLLALYWWYEVGDELENMSGEDLLKHLAKGSLTNPETIRRVRQKIQEECAELRGESYKERKKESEDVRKNI